MDFGVCVCVFCASLPGWECFSGWRAAGSLGASGTAGSGPWRRPASSPRWSPPCSRRADGSSPTSARTESRWKTRRTHKTHSTKSKCTNTGCFQWSQIAIVRGELPDVHPKLTISGILHRLPTFSKETCRDLKPILDWWLATITPKADCIQVLDAFKFPCVLERRRTYMCRECRCTDTWPRAPSSPPAADSDRIQLLL